MTYTHEIAKIEKTFLGVEDHGHLTFELHVNYGGAGQAVGGYSLDEWDPERRVRVGTARGMTLVAAVLAACGVDSWEQLPGRTIFVLTGENRRVVGIENLPTERGERLLFAELLTEPEPTAVKP